MDETADIHALFIEARRDDATALDRAFDRVYAQLRAIAHRALRGAHGATLNTTALVHEAYLALAGREGLPLEDRARFFAYAARAMRNILVDRARHHAAAKRGNGRAHMDLEAVEIPVEALSHEVLALDQALDELKRCDAELVRVVELRYFSGLSVDETAQVLGRAPRTVDRDWQKARAFLLSALA